MEILVGSTGFVGQNISASHEFDMLCNSKNITDAFGTNPELLVYSGVPAEMFLANKDPFADKTVIETAINNIQKINPKCLVLISTIAVLDNPVNAFEDTAIKPELLTAYGRNRLDLEISVREFIPQSHVIRLPALFGDGIKKNFIYDIINNFPAMLNQAKYDELSSREEVIKECYALQDNGFFKLTVSNANKPLLKAALERCNFSSLNFTDSRSVFQYYNLIYLWNHIEIMLKNNIPLLHMATEPISSADVYEYIFGKSFNNLLDKPPFEYDFRSKDAEIFGGRNGYIFEREQILRELKEFIERHGDI
ncbi:MAG: sugar nucleotide-binding protein [Lachnospiraceae bacterium]|nr:sugar nucleotide-binding protein [Lachnospiraceae bacterium]